MTLGRILPRSIIRRYRVSDLLGQMKPQNYTLAMVFKSGFSPTLSKITLSPMEDIDKITNSLKIN